MGNAPKTDWSSIQVPIPEDVKEVLSKPVCVNCCVCWKETMR